jgi:hypothetical protein
MQLLAVAVHELGPKSTKALCQLPAAQELEVEQVMQLLLEALQQEKLMTALKSCAGCQ